MIWIIFGSRSAYSGIFAAKHDKSVLQEKHYQRQAWLSLGRLPILEGADRAAPYGALVRRTVVDRLEGWLTLHDRHWPPKGEWNRLAAEIGVMPEALYREIAKCIRVEQLLPVPGRANRLDRLNSTARNTV